MEKNLRNLLENFKVIPLMKNDKIPYRGITYRNDKLTELELEKHKKIIQKNLNNINFGLLTGKVNDLCVIDFDYKDEEKRDVLTAKKLFNDWCELLGDKAVIIQSHSGGHHLYFKYRPLMNRSNSIKDLPNIPIDVRADNGYIVAPPSKRNKNSYKLIKGDLTNIPEMPDEIYNCLITTNKESVKKSKIERITKNMNELSDIEISEHETKQAKENLPYFADYLKALPSNYAEEYSDWLRIMIIACNLYHDSSDEATKKHIEIELKNFCKSTEKAKERYKDNDFERFLETTKNHNTDKLSILSLKSIVSYENPTAYQAIQKKKYLKLFEGYEDLKKAFDPIEFDKISKTDKYSYDICKEYFEYHFAYVSSTRSVWSLRPYKEEYCSLNQLKENFSNLTYMTISTKEDKKTGEEITKQVQDKFVNKWIDDINRKQYHDVKFCFNEEPPNVLNLFEGFYVNKLERKGIKPDFEKGQVLYNFIKNDLFRENKKQGEYIIKWIAQMIKEPKNPTNTALFLYGDKGCGKSTILQIINAMIDGGDSTRSCDQINKNSLVYSTPKINDLFDRFNSQAENKLCLCLEEAQINEQNSFKGDSKSFAQVIKDAITNRIVNIEKKYKEIKSVYSFARYIFISNFETALHIESGDRRFVMGECSNDYSHNSKMYNANYINKFWIDIYSLISNDNAILGFYKLLLNEPIDNINWERDRPNGELYEKATRLNKDIFIKYFSTIKLDKKNNKKINDTTYVKYEINHLLQIIKRYYKEKRLKFNKNDLDEELIKIKKIVIDENKKPIIKRVYREEQEYIIWDYNVLLKWLIENNYMVKKVKYDEIEDDLLDELLKEDLDYESD